MPPQVADRSEIVDAEASPGVFVTESNEFTKNIRGLDIEAIRIDDRATPTEIRSIGAADRVATSVRFGFSLLSRAATGGGQFLVGVIDRAPPGARWCGIDLESGDVVVYGPEAVHVGINPAGMTVLFVVVSTDALGQAFDHLEVKIKARAGSVERMLPSVATQRVSALVPGLFSRAPGTDAAFALQCPDVLTSVADLLATAEGDGPISSKLNDSRIIHSCIDCAERSQRIPTIDELCAAAHVSERRLRDAFRATQDIAPHAFFISWGLDLARRRLLASDPAAVTVAWVACGAGFYHLGRFARYYKAQYGESPSVTLRRNLHDETG